MKKDKPKILRTYECSIHDLIGNGIGTSSAQARYNFFREHLSEWYSYKEVFKDIRSKCIGVVKPHHFFTDPHSFVKMREYRNIPFAYQGMIIDVDGKKGWIVGSNGSLNLEVLFEGLSFTQNCHPTWQTTYYDNDLNIVKDFKEIKIQKIKKVIKLTPEEEQELPF